MMHFSQRFAVRAALLRALLETVAGHFPDLIAGVRGRGLMLGIRTARPPQEIVETLRAQANALTIPAGDNVVRVLPPLTVTDEEIHLFAERFGQTLAWLSKSAT